MVKITANTDKAERANKANPVLFPEVPLSSGRIRKCLSGFQPLAAEDRELVGMIPKLWQDRNLPLLSLMGKYSAFDAAPLILVDLVRSLKDRPPSWAVDPIDYFKSNEAKNLLLPLEPAESETLLDRIKLFHIKSAKTTPFTYFEVADPLVFYEKEIKAGAEAFHLTRVLAMNMDSQLNRNLTEFYFINSVYVGYGVTVAPLEGARVQLQFSMFESVPGTRFGNGRIGGLAVALMKERCSAISALFPGNTLSVAKSQYEYSPAALQIYRKLGFKYYQGNSLQEVPEFGVLTSDAEEYEKIVARCGEGIYLVPSKHQ